MTLFYSLLTPADTLSHSESSLITAADKKEKRKSPGTCRHSMNLPEVNLSTQLISIFYYTKTRISNIHNEYRVLQFSVWYIYLRFLLEHVQIERTTKKKKNQIPTLEKNKVQLSETLQHWETRCNRQRRNNYDQCSLQLHIAIMDKKKIKKKIINNSDNLRV